MEQWLKWSFWYLIKSFKVNFFSLNVLKQWKYGIKFNIYYHYASQFEIKKSSDPDVRQNALPHELSTTETNALQHELSKQIYQELSPLHKLNRQTLPEAPPPDLGV